MMITIRVRYAYCFLDIGLNIGKIKKEKKEEKKKAENADHFPHIGKTWILPKESTVKRNRWDSNPNAALFIDFKCGSSTVPTL